MDAKSRLTALLFDFARLTNATPPQGVVAAAADAVLEALGAARVAIWLSGPAEGTMVAHGSGGHDTQGRAAHVFSVPLGIRGVSYGHMQVEVVEAREDWPLLLTGLKTLALQLGLYGERYRLEQRRGALRRQAAQLRAVLATEKSAARASGIVARERGIGAADARRWLHSEALRTGRTPRAMAEVIIVRTSAPTTPGLPRGRRREQSAA